MNKSAVRIQFIVIVLILFSGYGCGQPHISEQSSDSIIDVNMNITDYSHIYESRDYIELCQNYGHELSFLVPGGDVIIPDDFSKPIFFDAWSMAQKPVTSITYGKNSCLSWCMPDTVQNLYIDTSNELYASVDGVIYSTDMETLMLFPIGRTGKYHILEGTKAIGDSAFALAAIHEVYVPDSIEIIYSNAFHCANLQYISLPPGVDYDSSPIDDSLPVEWIDTGEVNGMWVVCKSLIIEYRGSIKQWQADELNLAYGSRLDHAQVRFIYD